MSQHMWFGTVSPGRGRLGRACVAAIAVQLLAGCIGVSNGQTTRDAGRVGDDGPEGGTASGAQRPCAGARPEWIWCDDFEVDRLDRYFEYESEGDRLVRARGVGRNGSYGLRARFSAGTVDAGNLKLAFGRTPGSYFRPVDGGTANYRDVYWRIWTRSQPGWRSGDGIKMSRAIVFAGENWSEAAIAHVWNSSGGEYLLLDPASGTDPGGNVRTRRYNDFPRLRWLGQARGRMPLFAPPQSGTWHCVEARMRLNDPGLSNGIFELWIDGNLDAAGRGLNWLGRYDAYGINAIFLENYWNDGSPVAQERYFDDFVVSTRRIGC
jgi:hypothetical protein